MSQDLRLTNFSSREQLKEHILASSPYTREKNEKIYRKWFQNAPRYLFRAVNEKYALTSKTVCDVGCGYGAHLVFCPPGSYGIEIEEFEVKFAQSIGLTVHQRDVLYDSLEDLPKVDAVWNSAVLEHVESPHIFLRKLYSLLKPDGLLAIYVPTIPPFQFLKHLPRLGYYFTGYLYGDHINAFTPQTLKFFCERAGFETLEVSSFYPQPFSFLSRHLMLIDGCMYIGKKKEDWDYPDNATRRKANTDKGFVFNGQIFSSDGK